ncbi:MAG: ABC transporter permease [Pseudomonadota bacterium]
MLSYTLRRLMVAAPTLLIISLLVFLLLDAAPGDPMSQVPLTVPPEVRAQMREALGLGEPVHIRFVLWLRQMLWIEPQVFVDHVFGTSFAAGELRVLSWQTRAPVMDMVVKRLPQTLWVVGSAYLVGIAIGLPVGIVSAYRQHSVFDQAGTLTMLVAYSVPPFVTGPLVIGIFAVQLGWLPSIYDTTLRVTDWQSFSVQLRQMVLPVLVLAIPTAAQLSRYMRAAMLDTLPLDYIRTARAKGMPEHIVVLRHALRNSMIPVVTVIALGAPAMFGGAIITEQIFAINGIGAQLIGALQAGDLPTVQTLTFLFAVLIVLANLLADILYGWLDPRIRYD